MLGKIFKIHSDFYYIKVDSEIIQCKLRELLKKQKQSAYVGDIVKIECLNNNQAFICEIKDRKNYLPRPKASNIDQALIISTFNEPQLNLEQLDRFICFFEYHNIKPQICFNKIDLENNENEKNTIINLYKNLGYCVYLISTKTKEGISTIKDLLYEKITVVSGVSGVGKSSLINCLNKEINLKTKSLTNKLKKGKHTTRHIEMYEIENNSYIIDTPGFSNIKFDFILPNELEKLFCEFKKYKPCKFANCLHVDEVECNILNNIAQINKSRYNNYLKFLNESKKYKDYIIYHGKKVESTVKNNKNKIYTKISEKKRKRSRKTENQSIEKIKEEIINNNENK